MVRRMDEKGVSPVIGVILMVAITVILAAVIASFVFGLGSNVPQQKTPGVLAERVDSDTVKFTLTSWGGASNITACEFNGTSCTDGTFTDIGDTIECDATYGSHTLVCMVDGVKQIVWKGSI